MESCDVLIVGAGLLGCFAARALSRYDLKIIVAEARKDVCTGVSRANAGIIYPGYDNKPGSLKAKLCVEASRGFGELCTELDVPFSRCGSLMVSFGPRGERVLANKLEQGLANGAGPLRILPRGEVLELEPNLSSDVTAALFSPMTGTVEPWALGIAAYENAAANGADFRFSTPVLRLIPDGDGFIAETPKETFRARAVLNCAGLSSPAVRETCMAPRVRIFPTSADFFVLDDTAEGFVSRVIFHEPEEKGKGLTLVPTVSGNILVGPTERDPDGEQSAVSVQGLEALYALCRRVVPSLPLDGMIRTFAGLRPNPGSVEPFEGGFRRGGERISDLCILEEGALISLIGIKTPGLTCAHTIGEYAARRITQALGGAALRSDFDPCRRGIVRSAALGDEERAALIEASPEYGRVICRCRGVTEGEVREAIRRGAVTLDGVKRRVGAGMGRCQGSFCSRRIIALLAEAGLPVTKDGTGSEIFYGECHETN